MPGSVSMTVEALRERWSPTKARLREQGVAENTLIRMHRAFSWMQRAEQLAAQFDDDALVCQWVAFNAMYGRWDMTTNEPEPDRRGMSEFVTRVCAMDASGHIAGALREHRPLVRAILEEEYLSRWFWQDRTDERARKQRKSWFDAQSWYLEGRFDRILDRTLERVYLMRCQLVHGAATHGGKLNREILRRCNMMLGHALPAMLLAVMDHGAEEDWGPLCYPPTD